MHTDPVDWDDQPPPVPVARIWKPPEGDSWVVLLGHWAGLWIHWVGKRSLPCLNSHCPTARHQRPAHWVGYAPAALAVLSSAEGKRRATGWESVVVPISAEIADQLHPHLGRFPGPLLTVRRAAGKRVWTVAGIDPAPTKPKLPPAFDAKPTLWRVWGIRRPDTRPGPSPADGDQQPFE